MNEEEDNSAALHEQRQQELRLKEELERELYGDKFKQLELELEETAAAAVCNSEHSSMSDVCFEAIDILCRCDCIN